MDFSEVLDRAERWIVDDPEADTRNELSRLVNKARQGGPESAAGIDLARRFSGPLAFGTAGLRGPVAAGESCMNRAVVIRATAGLMGWLNAQVDRPRVVVGCDARHGSAAFYKDVCEVVSAAGGVALALPPAHPTPLTAFSVRELDADAGVMITASHNPGGDNGYKVYTGGRVSPGDGRGVQIVPPADAGIAEAIAAAPAAKDVPRNRDGVEEVDTREAYRSCAAALGRPGAIRVVLTPMHGVGGETACATLREAGFDDVVLVSAQADPDPDFPTVSFPNPEEKGALDLAKEEADRVGADLIIALDPDADRCAVCVPHEQGWRQLSGDETGLIVGEYLAARAARDGRGGAVATSIVSSRALAKVAAAHGLDFAHTLTGFKWIARTPELIFGYEEAIGYCPDPAHVADKDGIATAVVVASLAAELKADGRGLLDALDDIAVRDGAYRTRPVTFRVDDLAFISQAMAALRSNPPSSLGGSLVEATHDLARGYDGLPPTDGMMFFTEDDSRVVIRPSGTEPKLKCYLEAHVPAESGTVDWAEADRRLDALETDVRRVIVGD